MRQRQGVPWTAVADGLRLKVRLTPKSGHDRIEGVEEAAEGSVLKVRVRAVPTNGEANAALASLLASWLRLPKTSITVVAGAKQRVKALHISGDSRELANLVSARLGLADERAAQRQPR